MPVGAFRTILASKERGGWGGVRVVRGENAILPSPKLVSFFFPAEGEYGDRPGDFTFSYQANCLEADATKSTRTALTREKHTFVRMAIV